MHKILIRALNINDASISYKWRNDNEVWKYTGSRPDKLITEEIERNWLAIKLNETDSKRFAIEVDDIYIGNIQLTRITKIDAEFHIFIGNRNYWGKGVGYSAIQQILRFAENHLFIQKIYLQVNPENIKAIHLYERCGFKKVNENIRMEINLKDRILPTVSIFSMVYNHEKYIEQCLNSFLMQKTLFDFEIVIGEDFSSDRSREILLDFQNKYPGKFKLLLHPHNIGAVQNQKLTLNACTGKYIAICEGDDYWTDPLKLQKQVDFLEANEAYSMCFHRTDELLIDRTIQKSLTTYSEKANRFFEIDDLAKGNFIHTPSVVFKNNLIEFPKWMSLVSVGDYPLWMLLASRGRIGYLGESMAHYRVGVGVWSGCENTQNYIKWLELLSYLIIEFIENIKIVELLKIQQKQTIDILGNKILIDKLSKDDIFISKNITLSMLMKSIVLKFLNKLK